jgi:chitinase
LPLTGPVDWEHPSDPRQGADYVQLLALLRRVLPVPRYLLTSALPAGEWALRNVPLAAAAASLDLVNLMAYDFSGPWTPLAGHHAQLHAPPPLGGQQQQTVSGRTAVDYLLAQGVPAGKVVLGVPAYGRSFLGASAPGQAHGGHGGDQGTFEFRDLPRPGTAEQVDAACCAAFCIGGDGGFVTYDCPVTVREKARYAKGMGLAGLFYWTATGDADEVERSLVYNGYMELHTPPTLPR